LTGRTEIPGSGSNGKMLLWKTRSGERERERERERASSRGGESGEKARAKVES